MPITGTHHHFLPRTTPERLSRRPGVCTDDALTGWRPRGVSVGRGLTSGAVWLRLSLTVKRAKQLATAGFLFFLVKGLLWLIVPAAIAAYSWLRSEG